TLQGFAQTTTFPNTASPGLQTPPSKDTLQDTVKPSDVPYEDTTKEKPADEVKLDVPETKPSVNLQSPQFFVKHIEVEGSTLFKPEEFRPILEPYENKEVTLEELGKAVDAINKMYQKKGYLTTQAYVPPQDVETGNVT